MAPPRVLVADDQPDVLEALRLLLRLEGFEVESASSPAAAAAIVKRDAIDLVLANLNYARHHVGVRGLDLLTRLHTLRLPAGRR
jgi:CheY-like chemotaxis protein